MESLFDSTYTKEYIMQQLKELTLTNDNGVPYLIDRNIAISMAINALSTSERTSESLRELKSKISELKMQAEKDMGLADTNASAACDYGKQIAYNTCLKLMEELGLGVEICEPN